MGCLQTAVSFLHPCAWFFASSDHSSRTRWEQLRVAVGLCDGAEGSELSFCSAWREKWDRALVVVVVLNEECYITECCCLVLFFKNNYCVYFSSHGDGFVQIWVLAPKSNVRTWELSHDFHYVLFGIVCDMLIGFFLKQFIFSSVQNFFYIEIMLIRSNAFLYSQNMNACIAFTLSWYSSNGWRHIGSSWHFPSLTHQVPSFLAP